MARGFADEGGLLGSSEGIRTANIADVHAIDALLRPLAQQGIMKPRTLEQIRENISGYTVIEREGKACAPDRTPVTTGLRWLPFFAPPPFHTLPWRT